MEASLQTIGMWQRTIQREMADPAEVEARARDRGAWSKLIANL